ncbi:MAG: DUF5011 domain-containing protein [Clostridia bacterium]|nr:DUF5011 domain-containing protein [Clostridia bacterium]
MKTQSRKKTKSQLSKRSKIIFSVVVAYIAVLAVFLSLVRGRVIKRVKLEAGTPVSIEQFIRGKKVPEGTEFVTAPETIPVNVPGKYTVEIKLDDKVYTSTLTIVDTVAPKAKAAPGCIGWVGVIPPADDCVTDLQDATKVKATWRVEPDTSKEGHTKGTVLLTDAGGNTAAVDVTMDVIFDDVAPTLSGVKDYTAYVGEKLDYKSSVKVEDDKDKKAKLVVDDSELKPAEPGKYTVIYTAMDGAGNETVQKGTITLLADNAAPKIKGINNYKTCIGRTVDYKTPVTVSDDHDVNPKLEISDGTVDFSAAGSYTVTYTATDLAGNKTSQTAVIEVVKDTEAPVISGADDKTVLFGSDFDYKKVTAKDDWDPNPNLKVSGTVDVNKEGTYTLTYMATDFSGNVTTITRTVKVEKDRTPPKIEVSDFSVYIGASVSYKANVTVTDDFDENPKLEIDNSSVDITKAGVYDVIYKATDSSGNSSTAIAKFTVRAEPTREEQVAIYADEVLDSIIDDSMSDIKKVEAIYKWTKRNIGYTGTSNKDSWTKGAYDGFKKRSGDCFTYYAVTRALLTQAGIENKEVRKVRSSERASNHWWNLVYVNGGWYHVDSTPFKKGNNRLCLLTDKELAAYDQTSYRGEHKFDESKLPERSTESIQNLIKY